MGTQTNCLFITYVEKEGPLLKVWGQLDKNTALYVEQVLDRSSFQFDNGSCIPNLQSLQIGILCCAKYKDNKYYRARITSLDYLQNRYVEVNFVDYGHRDIVPISNIRSLDGFDTTFISIQPQATSFLLAEAVCAQEDWDAAVLEQISKDLRYNEVNFSIIAQIHKHYLVRLFVGVNDLVIILVSKGLMRHTSLVTQEAVLLSMMPRMNNTPAQQNIASFKAFTLDPGSQYEVYVSYITDGPCNFSIQLKQSEEILAKLMKEINSMTLTPVEGNPLPGTVCLARCMEDGHICRAVITNEVDGQYTVFYVDFGNYEIVALESLYEIPFKFVIPKVMAIRFALAGVEKATVTIEMQIAFKRFVDNRLIHMKVLPMTTKAPLPRCELWDPETHISALDVINRAASAAFPEHITLTKGFSQLVKVSYVFSCNRFYVQLKSKLDDLMKLMLDIQILCQGGSVVKKIRPGLPCYALYQSDHQWYRSQIVDVMPDEQVRVLYVDFGNEEIVSTMQLKAIEGKQLTILRPQAIECCLNGYQNMDADLERDNLLEELILEQEFTMKVVEMQGKKALIELIDSANYNVASLLLDKIAITRSQVSPLLVQAGNKLEHRKSFTGREQSVKQEQQRKPERNNQEASWRDDNKGLSRNYDRNRRENDFNDSTETEGNRGFRSDRNRTDAKNSEGRSWKQSRTNDTNDDGNRNQWTKGDEKRSPREKSDWNSNKFTKQSNWNASDDHANQVSNGNDEWTSPKETENTHHNKRDKDSWGGERRNKDDWNKSKDVDRPFDKKDRDNGGNKNNDNRRFKSNDNSGGLENNASDSWGDGEEKKDSWNTNQERKGDSWGNKDDRKGGRWDGKERSEDRWGNKDNRAGDRWSNKEERIRDKWGNKEERTGDKWGNKEDRTGNKWGNKEERTAGDRWGNKEERTGDRWGNKQERTGDKWGNKEERTGDKWGNKEERTGDKWGSKGERTEDRWANKEERTGNRWTDKGDRGDKGGRDNFRPSKNRADDANNEWSSPEGGQGDGFRKKPNFKREDRSYKNSFGDDTNTDSWKKSSSTTSEVPDPAPSTAKFKPFALDNFETNVIISWFHNPMKFYCQLAAKQNEFRKMMEDIQESYKGRAASKLSVGSPALALFPEDKVLYRAEILEIDGSQNTVNYVDFGNVAVISKVWPIETRFMELPVQAICCRLDGVQCPSESWPEANAFGPYFNKPSFGCHFISADNNAVVKLSSDGEDVATLLVRDGLASTALLSVEPPELPLLIGQQFRAMLLSVNSLADFSMSLQSGVLLDCAIFNLSESTETFENNLKEKVGQILIVYVDNLKENRLEVTLYDQNGTKIKLIDNDEAAYENVELLCSYLIMYSSISGEVTHVEENTVSLQPSDCIQSVENLRTLCSDYYENLPLENPIEPVQEFVYAVKSSDGTWYRGRVTKIEDAKVTVNYLDYGNSEEVEVGALRELTLEFMETPIMCLTVTVADASEDLICTNITLDLNFTGGLEGIIRKEIAPPLAAAQKSEEPIIEPSTTESTETPQISDQIGIQVILSHTDSPSEFYLQLADSSAAVQDLQVTLQDQVNEMPDMENAATGVLCAAPYSLDQEWYRAQVLDADDDITTVRFVDYGNTDVLNNATTKVKTLPPNLLSLEVYATRCSLKIKPIEEEWSGAAGERFAELCDSQQLTAQFTSQDEKTNYVELFSNGVNVGEVLVQEKLAASEVVPETSSVGFVSHLNSPSEFWIQLENCVDELEWVAEQLSAAESFAELEDLSPGVLCAALFPDDQMWYRARIISNTVAGIEVLFVDYGNSCTSCNLRQLPEDLIMLPALAQKCSLQKPEGLTRWGPEMVRKFNEISADGQTTFNVKKLSTGETAVVELLLDHVDVTTLLMPQTEGVTVKDLSSLEEFVVCQGDAEKGKFRLESLADTVWNEETFTKFEEINCNGDTLFQAEFVTDDTVRLYIGLNDIRLELSGTKIATPTSSPLRARCADYAVSKDVPEVAVESEIPPIAACDSPTREEIESSATLTVSSPDKDFSSDSGDATAPDNSEESQKATDNTNFMTEEEAKNLVGKDEENKESTTPETKEDLSTDDNIPGKDISKDSQLIEETQNVSYDKLTSEKNTNFTTEEETKNLVGKDEENKESITAETKEDFGTDDNIPGKDVTKDSQLKEEAQNVTDDKFTSEKSSNFTTEEETKNLVGKDEENEESITAETKEDLGTGDNVPGKDISKDSQLKEEAQNVSDDKLTSEKNTNFMTEEETKNLVGKEEENKESITAETKEDLCTDDNIPGPGKDVSKDSQLKEDAQNVTDDRMTGERRQRFIKDCLR